MCEEYVLIPESVQILHVNGNHWITVSTMDPGSDVTIYDSLHFTLHQSTKSLLAQSIRTSKKYITVRLVNTNRQAGENDCGVFATAYCAALPHGENPSTFGENPSTFVYEQKIMRNHLLRCLENGAVQLFPVIRQRIVLIQSR